MKKGRFKRLSQLNANAKVPFFSQYENCNVSIMVSHTAIPDRKSRLAAGSCQIPHCPLDKPRERRQRAVAESQEWGTSDCRTTNFLHTHTHTQNLCVGLIFNLYCLQSNVIWFDNTSIRNWFESQGTVNKVFSEYLPFTHQGAWQLYTTATARKKTNNKKKTIKQNKWMTHFMPFKLPEAGGFTRIIQRQLAWWQSRSHWNHVKLFKWREVFQETGSHCLWICDGFTHHAGVGGWGGKWATHIQAHLISTGQDLVGPNSGQLHLQPETCMHAGTNAHMHSNTFFPDGIRGWSQSQSH